MAEKTEGQNRQKFKAPYLTFVWAEDKNGLIGEAGDLPWSLPADMKHFKDVTINDVVVMGRRTYESIPNRPLKDRLNIILTRNKDYQAEGAVVCHSKEEIADYIRKNKIQKPIHIIGGASIFELFKEDVNMLYRTIIDHAFEGDTYMPQLDYKHFRVVDVREGTVDEKNIYPHRFFEYERKRAVDFI